MTGTQALAATVRALRVAPVKGLRLVDVEEIELTAAGALGDRRFYLIDERARMVNAKLIGSLLAVRADYDPRSERLALRFPDGRTVAAPALAGERVQTRFFSRAAAARVIVGPFSQALSDYAGAQLRLVAADDGRPAVDRGRRGGVSLISSASLARLSELAGKPLDARRFRMLIEVDGLRAHQEDLLVRRRVRIGAALIRFRGHVGRCLVTSRDPESGDSDLPTLELLRSYRAAAQTTEPLALGVWGEVLEGGPVRLGDRLAVDEA